LENQEASYYELLRHMGRQAVYAQYTITSRPVDKRENFIKRCIGISGDTVAIRDGLVFVNGKAVPLPNTGQTDYLVTFKNSDINFSVFEELGFVIKNDIVAVAQNTYQFTGSPAMMDKVKAMDFVASVTNRNAGKAEQDLDIYPHDPKNNSNMDNLGPLIVPKKGWTIKLDSTNMLKYARSIRIYEGNKLEQKGGVILINGKPTTTYTFKMNYYWMMGDNRHNSADSRYWSFVPEDHIVGKALFIWMSYDNEASFFHKIRWSRLFRLIH